METALLGTFLLNQDEIETSAVEAEDFERPQHRALLRLMKTMRAVGDVVDVQTVIDRISDDERAEQYGGIAYVAQLPNHVASVENAPGYARRLRERRIRREAALLAKRVQVAVGDKSVQVHDVLQRLTDGNADLLRLVDRSDIDGSKELRSLGRTELRQRRVGNFLDRSLKRMMARGQNIERPVALPWDSFNTAFGGGLWPGMHVVIGNTGTGKSQWVLQAALHAARAGVPVLYIGLELGEIDLVARLVGLLSERRWSRLYMGRNGDGEPDVRELDEIIDKHDNELDELKRIPFHLEVGPPMGWTYDRIFSKAQAMRDEYPETRNDRGDVVPGSRPFLIVLDFLQIVASPEGAREDMRERIGRAAYAARAVARDLGAVVILVSSTSRTNYSSLSGGSKDATTAGSRKQDAPKVEPGKTPASDLVGTGKESGEVEYAADSVFVFTKVDKADKDGPAPEWSEIAIAVAKCRAPTTALLSRNSWLTLDFNGGWFREHSDGKPVPLDLRKTP